MDLSTITVADFKAHFTRDFTYYSGTGCEREAVTDADISKAFLEASANFNDGLFSADDICKLCYLYLTAHFLVVDFQMAAQGLNSVGYNPVSSRSVGPVSEGYAIPEWVSKSTTLGQYTTTRYGQKYLALIRPLLIGNVGLAAGYTTP
jgi:hypothetical protein